MSNHQEPHEPEDLSVPEKIRRVQDLWDDIARSPRDVKLTPAQLEEAERRLQEYERDPQPCITWEALRAQLESEL